MRSYRRALCLLALAALVMLSCSVAALPSANDTPTPCPANCPPPDLGGGAAHSASTRYFTLTYYDPWSVDSSDANGVTLIAGTQLGDVEVVVVGQRVANGTTAQQLLSRTAQSQLDPNQFSGLQDAGPIRGAEIGYVAGTGETFEGYTAQANAPNTPVFIQMMASVKGAAGLTFTTVSPLDPNSPDPSGVPNEEYDRIANSVVWT
jgi:hypothetical protein